MSGRTRVGAFAAVLAVTLAVFAAPAGAAEETVGTCIVEELNAVGIEHFEEVEQAAEEGDKEAKEELEKIEEDLEDCVEAPNPILPEINEIIWGGLAFVILFAFMAKFGFPAIKKGMDARSERIQADLDGAENARTEAEAIKAEYNAELADAKTEASRIVDEAREAAGGVRADLEARAEADIAEMRERAAADVESARQQAIADVRGEISQLALGAAESVIGRSLDQQTQVQLIEEYIDQVGSRG